MDFGLDGFRVILRKVYTDLKQMELPELRAHLQKEQSSKPRPLGAWQPLPCPPELLVDVDVIGCFAPRRDWDEPMRMPALPPDLWIAYPRIQGRNMTFHSCSEKALREHRSLKVREAPEEAMHLKPQVLFVPTLLADRRGNRLGRGAGFYDRYLHQHHNVRTIGVLHSDYVIDEFPAHWLHKGDQRIGALITETFTLTLPPEGAKERN